MNQQEWIRLKDAISLIAENCCPDEGDHRNTKNKVRGKIRTATQKGLLVRCPAGSSWKFNRQDFLQWAVNIWPQLGDYVSIPLVIQGTLATMELRGFPASIRLTPSDPQELQDLLNRCRDELDQAKAEIQRLKPFEEKWKAEKKTQEERSKKLSDHAKKKRGPRTKR